MDLNEGLATIYSIVEKSKEVWLLSHETSKWNLDAMMEDGIVPKEQTFRGIKDRMTFATDAKNGEFKNIHRSWEGRGKKESAYVIFNRPDGVEHVYQYIFRKDPAGLKKVVEENLVHAMKDWFVTTRTVEPDNIALIYGYDGRMLYVREALGY
jgi:hypothetical protein